MSLCKSHLYLISRRSSACPILCTINVGFEHDMAADARTQEDNYLDLICHVAAKFMFA